MPEQKYKYTLDSSFENAYYDCKLVDDSIIDEKSYQECDAGLVLAHMDRILEAMEKQISKKPIKKEYKYAKCPSCNECFDGDIDYGFRVYGFNYCPFCGQKIDEGEENGCS